MSLHRTLVTQCRLFDSCTTHGRRILSQCVYQILSKQARRAAAWRLPLTFSFSAPRSSSRMAHAIRLWAKTDSSEAHLQEEIIFHCPQYAVSPASLASSPWPRIPGRESKISPAREGAAVRSGLWKQQVTVTPPPTPPHRARAFIPSLECCQVVDHLKCTPFVSNFSLCHVPLGSSAKLVNWVDFQEEHSVVLLSYKGFMLFY